MGVIRFILYCLIGQLFSIVTTLTNTQRTTKILLPGNDAKSEKELLNIRITSHPNAYGLTLKKIS